MMRKIDKLDLIKINNFCSAKKKKKKNRKKETKKPQTRRKNLENTYLIKNYYPKYMRNSLYSTIGKQTIQLENGQKI